MQVPARSSMCSPGPATPLLCASVSRLSKGTLDGGSLRAAPRAPFTCHGNGRPWKHGPLVPGDLTSPQARPAPGGPLHWNGDGLGPHPGHSWDCLSCRQHRGSDRPEFQSSSTPCFTCRVQQTRQGDPAGPARKGAGPLRPPYSEFLCPSSAPATQSI